MGNNIRIPWSEYRSMIVKQSLKTNVIMVSTVSLMWHSRFHTSIFDITRDHKFWHHNISRFCDGTSYYRGDKTP